MNFEHLDDPAGFAPDDAFRAAAQRDGRRRRRRRRLALTSGSLAASLVLVVVAAGGYGLWRTRGIDRVPVDFTTEPVGLGEPFNILLVGLDRRPDDTEGVSGVRSDTMIVVRVDPADHRLTLLSLPRDLVVRPDQVDGLRQFAGESRLNSALLRGGPGELVRTIETDLGIPLSHFVGIDFRGLVDLVDAVGGLPISVDRTVRDRATGLYLDPAPCSSVDGSTALALLRSRHLESLDASGRWVDDPSSDLGRITRQQAVLAALLPRLGGLADSLGGIDAALRVMSEHVTLDAGFDLATLADLGRWTTDGSGPELDRAVLPVSDVTLPDGARVLVLGAGSEAVIAGMGGSLPGETSTVALETSSNGTVSELVGEVPIGPCR